MDARIQLGEEPDSADIRNMGRPTAASATSSGNGSPTTAAVSSSALEANNYNYSGRTRQDSGNNTIKYNNSREMDGDGRDDGGAAAAAGSRGNTQRGERERRHSHRPAQHYQQQDHRLRQEGEEDRNLPTGIPQAVEPRFGGLQKAMSEITIDSTMIGLSTSHQTQHPHTRGGTSCNNEMMGASMEWILEDSNNDYQGGGDSQQRQQQQHRRHQSSGMTTVRSHESSGVIQRGVFPAEAGSSAMERLEARIRAKNEAADAATSSKYRPAANDVANTDSGGSNSCGTSSDRVGNVHQADNAHHHVHFNNEGGGKLAHGGNNRSGGHSRANSDGDDNGRPRVESGGLGDLYEARIQSKMAAAAQSLKPSATGNTRVESGGLGDLYEARVQSKMSAAAQSPEPSATGNTRVESAASQSPEELVSCTRSPKMLVSRPRVESGALGDLYEARVQSKMAAASPNSSATSKSRDASVSNASGDRSDRYEARIQAKLNKNKSNQTTIPAPRVATPGVEHVKEGSEESTRFRTLLERKQAGENVGARGSNRGLMEERPKDRPIPLSKLASHRDDSIHEGFKPSLSESEARRQLAESAKLGRCDEIIEFLRRNTPLPPAIIIVSLESIRECLPLAHGLTVSVSANAGPSFIAFPKSGWVKTIAMIMTSLLSNEIVQLEVLQTLWSVASLSPRYISDLTSNTDVMNSVIEAMETHHTSASVQEYGSGLLACLASSQKHALRLLEVRRGKFIQRLMVALASPSRNGVAQEYSLKALFRLSTASQSDDNPPGILGEMMGHCSGRELLGNESITAIDAVLCAMKQCPNNEAVQTHGNKLTWEILTPEAFLDDDLFAILVTKILNNVKDALAIHRDCLALHESVICLLSKLSCYDEGAVLGAQEDFSRIVVEIMTTHPKSWVLSLHGCRCLYNICAVEPMASICRSNIASFNGINAILACMETFPESLSVQGEACGALFAASCSSSSNKKQVLELGGIGKIQSAYSTYSATPYEDASLSTKIRAVAALTTLSVDPCALIEVEKEGILGEFHRLLKNDMELPDNLRHAILELLSLTSEDDDNHSRDFQDGASEEETSNCLLANLKALIPPSKINNRKACLLLGNTIGSVRAFPDSLEVQEYGCKVLSFLFVSGTVHTVGLEEVVKCLREHKNNISVAIAAVSAVRNFCSTQSLSSFDSYESQCLVSLMTETCLLRINDHSHLRLSIRLSLILYLMLLS